MKGWTSDCKNSDSDLSGLVFSENSATSTLRHLDCWLIWIFTYNGHVDVVYNFIYLTNMDFDIFFPFDFSYRRHCVRCLRICSVFQLPLRSSYFWNPSRMNALGKIFRNVCKQHYLLKKNGIKGLSLISHFSFLLLVACCLPLLFVNCAVLYHLLFLIASSTKFYKNFLMECS